MIFNMGQGNEKSNGVVLWEDTNTSEEFLSQTIDIDFSGFRFYEIIYVHTKTSKRCMSTGKVLCGYNAFMHFMYVQRVGVTGHSVYNREFTYDTKTFGASRSKEIKEGVEYESENNATIYPLMIIGYK